jgi:S1-C subfamily serine protease
MECPKCGHTQDDTVKCGSCGIYFAKFQQQQSLHAAPPHSGSRPEPSGIGLGGIALTALITGAIVYGFMHGRGNTPASVSAPPPAPRSAPPGASPATASASSGLEAQLAESSPARNAIEEARNATVFIRTGWGLGSGFIIDAACHVITNRHVVETDGASVANRVTQDPEVRARIALAEQQLQAALNQAKRARRALVGHAGTSLEQLELDNRIQDLEQEQADLPGKLSQTISDQVEGSARSGFAVSLADGTHFEAVHAEYAEHLDLALFQLPAEHCPHIRAGDSRGLALGERLYTIGNPSGLAYTVTSGVFSGERGEGQERVLQTDAPINPGNSGGPLITQAGRVVGINTRVMRGVQGIGFAIPIEAVYEEFTDLRAAQAER